MTTQVMPRPDETVRRILEELSLSGKAPAGARMLVVGVADTPDRGEVRESPALEIIDRIRQIGGSVSFTDDLVQDLRVPGGRMRSVRPGDLSEWDLVLVHTVHPETDLSWLADARLVLDASGRARNTAERQRTAPRQRQSE